MKRILFVDDESNVLNGLRRMLRPMRNEWDISFAGSGQEALEVMAHQPFDVIISDMRMPGMNGAELLNIVSDRYPQTVRFVLSGQSDRETIFRSIGPAHQFLCKPCDANTLKQVLARAFFLRDILDDEKLKALISGIKVLPSLPDLYTRLIKELKSEDPSIHRVGELIEKDVAMSAKVLQLVNSAFFGLRVHVTSPAQAAGLLGADIIRSLVLVVHVFKSNPLLDETGISPEALQHHSLFVGSAAQALGKYEKMDQKSADHLFAAGILHDVGKLVLASSRHQQYAEIMRRFMAGEGELVHLEREVLGAGHAEVGAYLLGLWGFPDPVIEAVAFHHEVSKYLGPGFDAVTAVHVANALDNITRSDHSPCRRSRIDMDYIEHLGMLEKLEAWRLVVAEVGGNAVAENPPEGHKHD